MERKLNESEQKAKVSQDYNGAKSEDKIRKQFILEKEDDQPINHGLKKRELKKLNKERQDEEKRKKEEDIKPQPDLEAQSELLTKISLISPLEKAKNSLPEASKIIYLQAKFPPAPGKKNSYLINKPKAEGYYTIREHYTEAEWVKEKKKRKTRRRKKKKRRRY
jgi:hypothetical protein